MRKSKKRVITIITCCFIIATFCVGVFADNVGDYNYDRLGSTTTTSPFDIGELAVNFDTTVTTTLSAGYYILKINYISDVVNGDICYTDDNNQSYYLVENNETNSYIGVRYIANFQYNMSYIRFYDKGTYYIYVYFDPDVSDEYIITRSSAYNSEDISVQLYSISDRSVIDSVYSNSQDVNSSIVNVINEATNVITTNDVVMMFCIMIPVISFGVGILIRLRKRA